VLQCPSPLSDAMLTLMLTCACSRVSHLTPPLPPTIHGRSSCTSSTLRMTATRTRRRGFTSAPPSQPRSYTPSYSQSRTDRHVRLRYSLTPHALTLTCRLNLHSHLDDLHSHLRSQTIPLYSYSLAGVVLHPSHARLTCAYAFDAGSTSWPDACALTGTRTGTSALGLHWTLT
jgi:hypothetical protein